MPDALATKSIPEISDKNNDIPQKPTATGFFRKTYIEVMRIIAAFLVIVNHTNSDIFLKYSQPESFTWYFSLTYFWISKVAVAVFLMIMGGLLLQKIDSPKKSFQRVLRMVVVLVVTSAVYYIYLHRHALPTITFSDFIDNVFIRRTNNAMWYLYTYIGLLILLPILQRIANALSKKAIAYLIFVSVGIKGALPLVNILFDIKINPYFTETFLVSLLGIVFVGFYIERHLKITKLVFAFSVIMFVAIISFEVMYSHYRFTLTPDSYLQLDKKENLNILLSAICFYIIFKYLSTLRKDNEDKNSNAKSSKIVCYFGSLTFGIYLLSDLAMFITEPTYLKLIEQGENLILFTLLWEIVIFALCAIVTAILKLIPGVKKYI